MKRYKLGIIVTILFLITPLRASVILLTPFFLFAVYFIQPFNISLKVILLICLLFISSTVGIIVNTTYVSNVLLSWYIIVPIIIILFATPKKLTEDNSTKIQQFLYYSIRILYIINILGFISYVFLDKIPKDDSFDFAYGSHFSGVNGLAMLNILFFFYFFSRLSIKEARKKTILNLLFFFVSFIFCFFGTGLMCLGATLIIYILLKFDIKKTLIIFLFSIISILIVKKFNETNINYIRNNLTLENGIPRKVLMYISYIDFINEKPINSFVGVGPGGYNGRVAFLLNKESDNLLTLIFGHQMPYFHEKNAFIYWNKEVANFESYTDGARNQPFSSIVSIFAEYGIIFGILFFIFFFTYIIKSSKLYSENPNAFFLLLIYIFIFISMLVGMWIESSEFLYFAIFQFFIRAKIKNGISI